MFLQKSSAYKFTKRYNPEDQQFIITVSIKIMSRYRHACAKGKRRYSFCSLLTSALDVGERSALPLGRSLPPRKYSGTYWIGGWVGHRAGLHTEAGRKIPLPLPEIEPRSSSL
jgi:hypothetical protein